MPDTIVPDTPWARGIPAGGLGRGRGQGGTRFRLAVDGAGRSAGRRRPPAGWRGGAAVSFTGAPASAWTTRTSRPRGPPFPLCSITGGASGDLGRRSRGDVLV